ncbi:xanthine dehydrogenase/oxidase-like [Anopheles darlingi]|uniref:xanthine dehydrogenase/oxidase-like n=1 Tax=Anopheles darlingi TaxID=43151 RepID=UPI0021002649|nr:xanthine dehydrogenase/oxidase-like [Anopheles darlingi]
MQQAKFTINGKPYEFSALSSEDLPVDTSLNTFIRTRANLKGTKFLCLEGGCGVCIVHIEGTHPVTRQRTAFSVNSCLFTVLSCHGMDVRTVEGIGSKLAGYHPVQERLAQMNGTQCGYCSPGMVMSMYGLLEAKGGSVTMAEVEQALAGNICRCTGYRPILDALKSFAVDTPARALRSSTGQCLADIEELPRSCDVPCASGSEPPCSARTCFDQPVSVRCPDNRQWYRVRTVDEVFEILAPLEPDAFMLVAGNTGHGVYRRSPKLRVFVDIRNVEELHNYWIGSSLIVGANVPLTEFIEILREAARKDRRFSYCKEVAQHVEDVAHPAVRNVGTIAGNLVLKYRHPEFPSDLFVLFEALGVEMTIVGAKGSIHKLLPERFLGFDLRKRIILNITLPALDPEVSVFRSYKIAPRAQNSKAYVNAGFLVRLCPRKVNVEYARLCFGGIDASFCHATATEEFVKGKNLFNNIDLQEALATLNGELPFNEQLRLPSSSYRRQVAVGLLYRFVLQLSPRDRRVANPLVRTGGNPLIRPLSHGIQSFDTYPSNWPLTQALPKLEALHQTAGELVYLNDLPSRPDELSAAFVLATKARCSITGIDAGPALALSGVVGFYSVTDLPGVNDFGGLKGSSNTTFPYNNVPELIFCEGRVLYHGQPIGVLVANTFARAQEAAKLVVITYGPPDGPILPTVADVMAVGATERIATVESDVIGRNYHRASVDRPETMQLRGSYEFGSQAHFATEPHACLCIPTEDGLEVYSTTQTSQLVHLAVSKALAIPQNTVNVIVPPVGGSFGGKMTRSGLIACTASLAALHTKRPVRMVVPFETIMQAIGKRIGAHCEYSVHFDAQSGRIVKLQNEHTQDFGCSSYESMAILFREAFKNCYNGTDLWRLQLKGAVTDAPSNTWLRSPGTAEAIGTIETIMEHIAFTTGLDPLAVRLANMDPSSRMATLLPAFQRDVDFLVRKAANDRFNETNRWKKRGISIVPTAHPITYFGGINAWVSIYHVDGSVAITHGGIEMGQSINTKTAQVAAHILGIPLAKISMKPHSTVSSPNSFITGGSIGTDLVTYSVKRACEMLLERIRPVRDENRTASWEATVQTCYQRGIDLTASYFVRRSDIQPYTVWALCCVEVELDLLTGQVQLPRVDILEDTGESMNPLLDIGQIEGAFMMAMGLHLMEELQYDRSTGELLNSRTWTYKPPMARDIPIDFRVRLLQKSSNAAGVLRSKTTGEPAYNLGVTVAFALRYALWAARRDAGLPREWLDLGTSLTVEKILSLTGNTIDQFVLH